MALSKIPPAGHAQYTGARNLVTNGAMTIAQRGTSATGIGNGNSGYHTVDRFRFIEGGSPTYQFTLSQSTTAPTGFSNSLKLDCTTADTSLANDVQLKIDTRLEGQDVQHLKYGTSSAETITLSFWVRSNLTGNYVVWFFQPDDDRSATKTYTINAADTWEHKSITLSGDQTGIIDNNNGLGLQITWFLGAGTNYTSGTANTDWQALDNTDRAAGLNVNLSSSTSNEWYLTGVQLEVGDTATDFEHRSFEDELHRCKRYYQQSEYDIYSSYGATYNYVQWFFVPEMRATPSLSGNLAGTSDGVNKQFAQRYNSGSNYAYFYGGSNRTKADAEL